MLETPAAGMTTRPRHVFILLSSRSLPYAHLCIRTMLANTAEPIRLRLLGDDPADVARLAEGVADITIPAGCSLDFLSKNDVSDQLSSRYPQYRGLFALHDGHPCWRKIIDPLILSEPDDEVIVTDPDLFFPNRYTFEPTPSAGVMMMRQGPNCLYPPDAVRQAFDLDIKLANHVDIGVAQVRAGAVDLDWLDWLTSKLDLQRFRPFMHIEAIVWSAMAMRMGGEHLNPSVWRCWERGKIKRLAVALGMPGVWTLKLEALDQLKCIHVSGPSKWWVKDALERGVLREFHNPILAPVPGVPYRELTRSQFENEQRLKRAIAATGLVKVG
jgi:hypothetical protein